MSDASTRRLQQLDLLRCVAVILVIGRHMPPCPPETSLYLHHISKIWIRGGWVGVDLFFVLSGFLVSGLIFREYKRQGTADLKRFLIRRGFKIYPAFWVLLAVTTLYYRYSNVQVESASFFGELFFLQNYVGYLWGHTWSLAVEEHFYILLALLFYVLLQRNARDAFAAVPGVFIVLAVSCFLLRMYVTISQPYSYWTHLFPTHLRIDALFFGVLISYFWNFSSFPQATFLSRNKFWICLSGVVLFIPPFIFEIENTPWLTPVGLSLLYFGGGAILVSLLSTDFSNSRFIRPFSYVGKYSYSIYLWHLPVGVWGMSLIKRFIPLDNWPLYFVVYFLSSIIFGILMAKSVEYPFLRIRDAFYPSKAAPLASAALR